jgi:hypothetical protein
VQHGIITGTFTKIRLYPAKVAGSDAMTPKLVLKTIYDKSICTGMHGADHDGNHWHWWTAGEDPWYDAEHPPPYFCGRCGREITNGWLRKKYRSGRFYEWRLFCDRCTVVSRLRPIFPKEAGEKGAD